MKACKAVGSVSDSCFDIRFNPDVSSPGKVLSKRVSPHLYSLFKRKEV